MQNWLAVRLQKEVYCEKGILRLMIQESRTTLAAPGIIVVWKGCEKENAHLAYEKIAALRCKATVRHVLK